MALRAPRIKNVSPSTGVEGGKVWIEGAGFDPEELASTLITFGDKAARPLLVSGKRILVQIPEDASPGPLVVAVKGKRSGEYPFQTGLRLSNEVNPVDNPAFDHEGNLYVGFSGRRGETPPVSVYRITPDGAVTPHITNVPNATSLAFGPDRNLYISSRFEGTIYRCTPEADTTVFARELGTPTGLAFDREGFLYAGDRAGRILKISPEGEARVFAEVAESSVAFHLAFDPDGNLLVSNPNLSGLNHIMLINRFGKQMSLFGGFGRPQGMAVDRDGSIYVCEAKVGESTVLRITHDGKMTPILTGSVLVGIAFGHNGQAAVATTNAVYRVTL